MVPMNPEGVHGQPPGSTTRSEMYCMRLAANTGRKNRNLSTIAQICRAIASQLSTY